MYGTSPRCAARIARNSRLARPLARLDAPPLPASLSSSWSQDYHAAPYNPPGRNYATTTAPPQNIAVLGAGVTGLATAYYLSKYSPDTKITIYEAESRLGGWADTKEVFFEHGEGEKVSVLFERGPRTVPTQHKKAKRDDLVFLELVHMLGLEDELIAYPATLKRYIYYPDHLVDIAPPPVRRDRILAAIYAYLKFGYRVLNEPLFEGAPQSALHWFRNLAKTEESKIKIQGGADNVFTYDCKDISIGEFFSRMFGQRDLVDNLLSAMLHGIYGGDVWNLSMESSMFQSQLINSQAASPRNHVWALVEDFRMALEFQTMDHLKGVRDLERRMAHATYMSFRNGFSSFTDAMADALNKNPNVTIKVDEPVTSVSLDKTLKVAVGTTKSKQPTLHDKVVSTLFAKTLANTTNGLLPALAESEAVNIRLVNLWYPRTGVNKPNYGFGYLVPQSIPFAHNPEAALGVLFDSDREVVGHPPRADTIQGTTMTVMLGGHLWDGLPPSSLPTDEDAIALAKKAVARHLRLSDDEPVYADTKLCTMCIPQHRVGHFQRMARAHTELQGAFRGRLMVAGPSYTTPGVLTSLRAARDAMAHLTGLWTADDGGPSFMTVGDTGLERFLPGRRRLYPVHMPLYPMRRRND